jgi:hypothetical protein
MEIADTWDSVAFYHDYMRLIKRLRPWATISEMYLIEARGDYP